jgi:hypothetical protein
MSTVEDACSGNWSDWSVCDAKCNPDSDSAVGKQKKIYTIKKPLNNNSIKTIETDIPCTKLCPLNCIGKYNDWGDCNATCSNNQIEAEGEQTSDYVITRPASNGGLECSNNKIKSQKCKKICPVNCVGEWSNWSECVTPACNGKDPFINGKKTRKYTIITPASNGGAACNIENGKIETADCRKECSVNSMYFWVAVIGVPILIIIGIIFYFYNSKQNKAATAAAVAAAVSAVTEASVSTPLQNTKNPSVNPSVRRHG